MTLNIAIAGASGRMGRALLEAIAAAPDMRLSAALERAGSPLLGRDAGELVGTSQQVAIRDDFDAALKGAHALIDFTRPEATLAHIEACKRHGVALVIGTTGFDEAGKAAIADAATVIPVVFAPT
jgi:4-hydroxy-tetrahydrodipicolinate reductase